MICLLVLTDGRDELLVDTVTAAAERVPFTRLVIHDDTGDLNHRQRVHDALQPLAPDVIGGHERRGFGGAIGAAWRYIANVPEPFVFHLEDDFHLTCDLDLQAMVDVLDTHPHLVQLALRRQPWNPEEEAAGGIVEQHPGDYLDCEWNGHQWLEHTRFFTTNPSIYRRSLCARGWPEGANSEGRFGIDLLADHPDWRFGFWGARDSGEWCRHVGHDRVGTGY